MKFTKLTMLAIIAAAGASAYAQQAPATPDPVKGQAMGSTVCAACHGADGNALAPTFPKLAGQHYDYLVKQLNVFQRTDERPEGAIMKVIAHDLTPEDILAVASYAETLP